ncbi:MAG: Lrp/AsnC family transcriptional regulator [Candidatus ainarchaeum sp.]|nr:Lrp/AsnC family transcriptional regulator [Candidatus ainarchaeum sp.]
MKNIRQRLIALLKTGFCAPKIGAMASRIKEPAATIHYNVKKLESDGAIKTYKAVFDYKQVEMGFCTFVLINLSPTEYSNPEKIANELATFQEIESVDVITGDWEIIAKIRTKDIEEYYAFTKRVLSRPGVVKIRSLNSLKQVKTEFISL